METTKYFGLNKTQLKIACVSGLLMFYLAYGVFQEKIMQFPYVDGDHSDVFTSSYFLVGTNRIVTVLFATFQIWRNQENFENAAPLWTYAAVALSNVLSTGCQYEALKYVSFPVQTLGKSGKIIAVMIVGTLINKKSYQWREYGYAVGIMLGLTAFFLTGEHSARTASEKSTELYGLMFMGGYLFFDSFTSTFQEKMFKSYKMSSQNQILYTNLWAAFLSFTFLAVNQEIQPTLQFIQVHPGLLRDALLFSLVATMGQQIISVTIKEFGALLFSTVMTVRQFISVLISSFFFGPMLTLFQLIAAVFVSTILWLKDFNKPAHSSPQESKLPVLPVRAPPEKSSTPSENDRD